MTRFAFPTQLPRSLALLSATVALGVVATAAAPGVIRIQRGDTLSALARKHGTSVAALRELNKLGGNNLIIAGRTLRIARVPVVRATKPAATRARWVEVVHTVVRGDTLSGVAQRYGQTPAGIARRNSLPRSKVIRLGQRLVVGSRRVAPPARAINARKASAVRRGVPPAIPRDRVRSLVLAQARKHKVDPHLALALAWQESGLQQDVVSSVGALGVMQVMPTTGEWVSRYLAKRPLDLYDVEDNVEAGVRYLAQLLKVAKTKDLALAGYYQGLHSVAKRGMYDDTKRYVTNITAIRRRLAKR
ncbi:MAG TPA: LysM peptidoglycan-binding domain-containing protein [Mycobacteriales bacterium]|nr:LysM peptidoglycan-binding domain-containing protein [Mycobacteriales bacterium]